MIQKYTLFNSTVKTVENEFKSVNFLTVSVVRFKEHFLNQIKTFQKIPQTSLIK